MSDKIFKYKVVIETVDKPLKSMQEQLKSINDIFKKQREETKKTTGAIGNLANMYKKFEIGKLAISGIGSAMSGVAGIAGKGMGLMKEFGGSVVDAMQFRERAVFSLGRAFGDGSKKLQEVIDIASKTTMDTGPMVTMANALSTSFKHWEDVKKIMVLGGDVLYQFPELEQQFTSAFQKAGSGGMLEAGSDLLKAISGGYIGYKREIAKQLGLKGKDLDSITKVDDLIKAAKKNGKLTGRELTRALIKSLKAGLKMENIGDITMGAASGSLVGAISNFKSAFSDVLVAIDWENLPGVGELKRVLGSVTQNIMSQDTRNALRAAIDNMLAPLEKLDNEKIGSIFKDTLIPGITKFGAIVNSSLSWLVDLMTGNVSISSSTEKVWIALGETIGAGIALGIKHAMPTLGEVIIGGTANLISGGRSASLSDKFYNANQEKKQVQDYINDLKARTAQEEAKRKAEEKRKEEEAAQIKRDSYGPPSLVEINMSFYGPPNPADAQQIANAVAQRVKEAAKELRKSGGKS